MAINEQLITARDLLYLTDKPYQLIEGRLIEMSPTGKPHGLVTNWLAHLLTGYVVEHKLGQIFAAESGFRLSADPDTVLGIDVAFVSTARIQSGEGYFEGAPDLAVEVMSPGNRGPEMHTKVSLYFRAGARLVWVLYPQSRAVYVYRSPNVITVLDGDDLLDGSEVIPGFSVKVSEIFSILDD